MTDITGQRFGKLVAIRFERRTNPLPGRTVGRPMWLFSCDCGGSIIARISSVKDGNTSSCGCSKTGNPTHGASKGKTLTGKVPKSYSTWCNINRRCSDTNDKSYGRYGGRGIKVCERWSAYEKFLEDMGEPELDKSIDRIDNSMGYSPDNCRWATMKEQNNNRRDNVTIVLGRESHTLKQFSELYGFEYKKLHSWKQKGICITSLAASVVILASTIRSKTNEST